MTIDARQCLNTASHTGYSIHHLNNIAYLLYCHFVSSCSNTVGLAMWVMSLGGTKRESVSFCHNFTNKYRLIFKILSRAHSAVNEHYESHHTGVYLILQNSCSVRGLCVTSHFCDVTAAAAAAAAWQKLHFAAVAVTSQTSHHGAERRYGLYISNAIATLTCEILMSPYTSTTLSGYQQ